MNNMHIQKHTPKCTPNRHTYSWTPTYTYRHMHIHMLTHMKAHTHALTHSHTHIKIHMHTHTHACTYACIHIHMLTCIHVYTHRDKYILHLFTDELFTLPHLSGVKDGAFKDFHFADLSHNPHTCSESTFSTEPSPKSNTGWLLRKSMMIFKKKV